MRLALEIRFLTGRYVATHYNDRRRAEWPPHPARIYSALVAALHDGPKPSTGERDALRWLEASGSPDVIASDAELRIQSEVYVPTNDARVLADIDKHILAYENVLAATDSKSGRKVDKARRGLLKRSLESSRGGRGGTPSEASRLLPAGRSKQPRTFPVAVPHEPIVHVIWSQEASDDVAHALDQLASRVARLGHSSSLVSCRFLSLDHVDSGSRRTWRPETEGRLILRVPQPGQLERLEEAHERHRQIEPRLLPTGFASYSDGVSTGGSPVPSTNLSERDWFVFEVTAVDSGARRRLLDLSLGQTVARAFRGTLMRAADGAWPEALSGHGPDGAPSQKPHLAFVPLADVGHRFATGSILGLALVLPAGLEAAKRDALLRTIAMAEQQARRDDDPTEIPALELKLGRHGVLQLRRTRDISTTRALQTRRWARTSRRWATASAIALERNPGNLHSREPDTLDRAVANAESIVSQACTNVGLPVPAAVWIHRRSVLRGVPAAKRFMPYPSTGEGHRRVCVHAEVLFHESVRGPVILGAGRYFGVGLCSPLEDPWT